MYRLSAEGPLTKMALSPFNKRLNISWQKEPLMSDLSNPPTTPRRIKIEVLVPAGQDVTAARQIAKLRAAEQLNLHIVEEVLLPSEAAQLNFPTNSAPNDSSVDRVLTTWWSIHS